MTKRTVFSTISPLPAGISREVVVDFLHNHTEMIDLNPLVIERHFINTPENVDDDERHCVWYSMTDKIDYLPGGKVSGNISYTCAFHDLSNGLQTHCRAPLGVDIRSKWTLNGSLPGESPERRELGIGAPASGLYLREDVDLRCNILVTNFVKKNLKRSHAALVVKLVEKAKLVSMQTTDQAPATSVRTAPPNVAAAMSHPWLPPTQPSPPGLQRQNSNNSYASSQESWRATPPQPHSSASVEPRQQVPDPTVRYSGTSAHHVPQPYRAPSQHSNQMRTYSSSSALPDPPLPSQHNVYGQSYSAHPPPPYLQRHVTGESLPLYLDGNLDIVPAPLRVSDGSSGARSRASTNASTTHSRTSSSAPSLQRSSSSEYEHPEYRHRSLYTPELTEGSSSPDEPRLPDVVGRWQAPGHGKGYFDETNHPEVLRPGSGGTSGRLSGRLTGPFIMAELE